MKKQIFILFVLLAIFSCQRNSQSDIAWKISDSIIVVMKDTIVADTMSNTYNIAPPVAKEKTIQEKQTALAQEIFGKTKFTQKEEDVFVAKDNGTIVVFSQKKYEKYAEEYRAKFKYEAKDYFTGNNYVEREYPKKWAKKYASFKFVGIIYHYERGCDFYEFQHKKGKRFFKSNDNKVFLNCENCPVFDAGKHITTKTIVEE
ncbi:MAG: hypothetical protein FWC39_02730 [Bacteroidetes bacterium]|nr:hypothetical protein [Bacteroidota bacterium]